MARELQQLQELLAAADAGVIPEAVAAELRVRVQVLEGSSSSSSD